MSHPIGADLEAGLNGDREALARALMAESAPLSRRVAERLKLNPFVDFSADDVMQEVFVDVFRGIQTFDPQHPAGWVGWLNKVVDNRVATMLRERSRKKRGGDFRRQNNQPQDMVSSAVDLIALLADEAGGTPSTDVARDEMVHALQVGIATLPEDQREAVLQHYLRQRTLGSTADAMNKTDGAVRGLLHRAKKSLRDVLGSSTTWFARN